MSTRAPSFIKATSSFSLYKKPAVQTMLGASFGKNRLLRPVYTLRHGPPLYSYALVRSNDSDHEPVSVVFFWSISVPYKHNALLLGPIAVRADSQNEGHGSNILTQAINDIFFSPSLGQETKAWSLICVSGSYEYYNRFGFQPAPATWRLPGGSTPPLILMLLQNPSEPKTKHQHISEFSGDLTVTID